jgi:excisionase family DNA binding protein
MKKYYSIPQAAKACSVSRSTMHRWVTSGKINSYSTPGGHNRILPEDLKRWLEVNQMPFDINEFKNTKSKILIVDDDTGIQNYLKRLLSGPFMELDMASDGFEAGKKLIQFDPDLMILDLHMPGMDGFEVCKKVKEDSSTRRIKILIMTGDGTKENMDKTLSIGADAFLRKPSSKKEIIACVEKLLKSK